MATKYHQPTPEEEEANDIAYDTWLSWEIEKHFDRQDQAKLVRSEETRLGRSLTSKERKALIWPVDYMPDNGIQNYEMRVPKLRNLLKTTKG